MKLGGVWHLQFFLHAFCFLDLLRLSRVSMFWSAYMYMYMITLKGLSLRFRDVDLDYDNQVSIIGDLNPSVLCRPFKKRSTDENTARINKTAMILLVSKCSVCHVFYMHHLFFLHNSYGIDISILLKFPRN